MNLINTTEDFISSRKGIYEPDAVSGDYTPDVLPNNTDGISEERPDPVRFTAQEIIIPKARRTSHTGLILLITALAGAVIGFLLYDRFFSGVSKEDILNFLTLRIKGGFFQNVSSSFFGAAAWLVLPFIGGLCAIGQPATVILPALKGTGTGIILAQLISIYGFNGIYAFAVLVLPSAALGTFILVYQCRCALTSSTRLLTYIRGKGTDARPKSSYGAYLYRSLLCAAGCLAVGLTDAVISLFAGNWFIV